MPAHLPSRRYLTMCRPNLAQRLPKTRHDGALWQQEPIVDQQALVSGGLLGLGVALGLGLALVDLVGLFGFGL